MYFWICNFIKIRYKFGHRKPASFPLSFIVFLLRLVRAKCRTYPFDIYRSQWRVPNYYEWHFHKAEDTAVMKVTAWDLHLRSLGIRALNLAKGEKKLKGHYGWYLIWKLGGLKLHLLKPKPFRVIAHFRQYNCGDLLEGFYVWIRVRSVMWDFDSHSW